MYIYYYLLVQLHGCAECTNSRLMHGRDGALTAQSIKHPGSARATPTACCCAARQHEWDDVEETTRIHRGKAAKKTANKRCAKTTNCTHGVVYKRNTRRKATKDAAIKQRKTTYTHGITGIKQPRHTPPRRTV